jgi:hypothetical protein
LGLFGHHHDYPNGNPADLAIFDALGQAPNVIEYGARTNLAWLQLIASGVPVRLGPGTPFPDNPNDTVTWSDGGDAGRRSELAYVRRIVAGLTGTIQAQPTANQIPRDAPAGTDLASQLADIAARAEGAGQAELFTRLGVASTAAAGAAGAREQRASLVPNLTPMQVVIVLVVVVLLFLFIKRT